MLEIRDKIMNFNNIHRKSSGKSIRKLEHLENWPRVVGTYWKKGKKVNKKEKSKQMLTISER